MFKLLKRWMAYLLIPAGLVLLFIPLHTYRSERTAKDFVFLEISETLAGEKMTTAKPAPPTNGSMESVAQWLKEKQRILSEEHSNIATIRNSYGYPTIHQEDLTPYPALREQVNDMMRMLFLMHQERIRSKRLDNVPIEEWGAFKKAFFGYTDDDAFQYGNLIFRGHVESDYASIQVEVENLKTGCTVAGGVFLFLGLFALYGMYTTPSKGIQIGKRMGMIIWDVITMGIGIMFTWWFLDSILVKYFQTDSVWGDEMAVGMGIFWVVFVNPLMALIATATALQTLWVTRKGITVKGLFGQSVVAWPDVESIQLLEFFTPRKIYGILTTRKVAKVLEIRGGSSSPLRILEPPLALTKKEILNRLTEYAPEELKESISGLSKEWLCAW